MRLPILKLTKLKTKIIYVITYTLFLSCYLATPIIVMKFINSVIEKKYNELLMFSIIYFVLFILTQLISYAFSMMVGNVEKENFINFYKILDDKIKTIDFKYSDLTIESLNQQMGQNYEIANSYFFIQPVELVFSILNIISLFIVMMIINWQITLILTLIIPVSFIVSKLFENKMYRSSEDNLLDIKNIKSFENDQFILSKEERFLNNKQLKPISPLLSKYKRSKYLSYKTKSQYLYFFTYAFINLAILIVIVMSGIYTYNGLLSIGVLYAFQNYTSQLWNPAEYLMSYKANYEQAKPAINDIISLMNIKTSVYSHDKIKCIELIEYQTTNNNIPINEKLNIVFTVGNTYIINGDNGSGKTSLIEAILGFNSRYTGKIQINGDSCSSDDFVYIPSTYYISSFSNKEHDKLSSGQAKLEQITSAIKTDKTVYIFDEPTNYIDNNNKSLIINLIKNLSKLNKLIIIVTHDSIFSSYNNCKKIQLNKLVDDKADIIE